MDIPSAAIVWLHEWQTLVAGLIAIIAAVIGWKAINGQVQQTERHEQERIARRFDAARATLPLTLGHIVRYTKACESYVQAILLADGRKIVKHKPQSSPPELPSEGISELRALIESSLLAVRARVSELLADLQIQHARLEGVFISLTESGQSTIVTRRDIAALMIEAAIVGAQAGNLYQYARRQTENVPDPIDWDKVSNELSFKLMDDECAIVGLELEERKSRGLNPQIA